MKYMKAAFLSVLILFSYSLIGQVPDSIPSPVLEFYGKSIASKKANDRAPLETIQFGQLAGIWYCSGSGPDVLGKVDRMPYKGFWAFKYILDGYGVQDFFYQGKDEYRFWDYFKRDATLTQLRVYDPENGMWKIAYITNNGGEIPGPVFGTFTTKMEGSELIMKSNSIDQLIIESDSDNQEKISRVVFFDITENSFEWRSESSADLGETWDLITELSAQRLK